MTRLLRALFFVGLVRPIVMVLLGVGVRHRERLRPRGPMIVVANHNSHLDTLVLMTLFPLSMLPQVRPVAAADYFLRNRWLAWFATGIIGIIPIRRRNAGGGDPLAGCDEALARGDILILFPEGTRGEPEQLAEFKSGIAHLAKRHPDIPIVPLYMCGLGRALPKGEFVLVPVFIDIAVGPTIPWCGDKADFMARLTATMQALKQELPLPRHTRISLTDTQP